MSKINWAMTWLGTALLKKGLGHRLHGEGAKWLQQGGLAGVSIYNRVDFILDYCKGKNITHAGFTDHPFMEERIANGSLLHLQLKQVAGSLSGIDIAQPAIDTYKQLTQDNNVYWADIVQAYPQAVIAQQPEVIVLSEVLEHLPDPYRAVETLYHSFGHGVKLLVTVPNYTSLDSMAASLHRTESIHPDHYWYFSPFTLQRLFGSDRFKPEALHFGMYYGKGVAINAYLKKYPFTGDCILAVFSINKP